VQHALGSAAANPFTGLGGGIVPTIDVVEKPEFQPRMRRLAGLGYNVPEKNGRRTVFRVDELLERLLSPVLFWVERQFCG